MYLITFLFIEYVMPSKRYNENGEPEFVMPTLAILGGFIIAILVFIFTSRKLNTMLKNKVDGKV
ncbi:hypothetical protein [Flavobacterium urocaniciphilum]|uniref:Uncharacterized protein n=1 Tax=Flavobacterium urocaniciphilum TaxID=1299341 RepID=A0A1H9DJM3_9FLAO|nr:hypothetical protein [Flavobacterium urocaniciphilum]SEQ13700.1 hypothetical protein SAMN05444005_10783 [Flavobacterium urocaniciphilum]